MKTIVIFEIVIVSCFLILCPGKARADTAITLPSEFLDEMEVYDYEWCF